MENNVLHQKGSGRSSVAGLPFSQRDIQKIIKATKNAGSSIGRIEFDPVNGTVVFICSDGTDVVPQKDHYTSWKVGRS